MDEIKIIYILIGTGSKPLAGYGVYKGEFIQICERKLKSIEPNKSATVSTPDYKIFYQNKENVTYLIMTIPSYPMAAAVACLDSMYKEFGTELNGRNFAMLKEYGLNSDLKEKLKMKFDYYDKNTEIVDEQLEGLKNVMKSFKNEVMKAASDLETRGGALNEMQNKASELESDSYTFKKRAHQVKMTECKKKAIYIGVILAIVAIIVLIIVLCVK